MAKKRIIACFIAIIIAVGLLTTSINPALGLKRARKKSNTISVVLRIKKSRKRSTTYYVKVKKSSTVFDVFKAARKKYKHSKKKRFSFEYEKYSYGVFITKINGLKNNNAKAKYWLYYINGKLANRGASQMRVKKGDVILWKYQKADSGL